MAYNERLAERVRAILAAHDGISERKMFGGLAFLVNGKMCVGVMNDEFMVRSGPAQHAAALKKPHARPMDFTGRPMTGMVYVSPAGVSRGPALRRWIELGIAGAAAAPSSKRSRSKKAARP